MNRAAMQADLSPDDQIRIRLRSDELLAERLANGRVFHELMSALDGDSYYPYLHAATLVIYKWLHSGRANEFIPAAAIVANMSKFANVVFAQAETDYRAECDLIAKKELA